VRTVRAVRVRARAKLNLGLAVGPRRPDGFHEIATVFQSVTLADTLEVRRRPRGFLLAVRWEDVAVSGPRRAERIPAGRANLVLRAARLLARRAGIRGGASFRLVKRIPAGAGLGGGSADAAAALAGLARLYGIRLDPSRRLRLAARLGSDVPFACLGGTALGTGRGERLQPLRLASRFRALVAVPPWRVATRDAYRRLGRGKYGLTGWTSKLRFAQSLGQVEVTALQALRLGNTFEMALGRRRADFQSLIRRLRTAGAQNPRMTGSGSAAFGILRPGESVRSIIDGFEGDERLYVVGSARSSMRVTRLP
jgi:4-diphosphocytidyl-2-C-methyl-D-erythritol kinase